MTLLARWDSLLLIMGLFTFGAPLAAVLAVNLWYDWLRSGNVFTITTKNALEGSYTTPLWTGLYGLLLSPGAGLIIYVPVLLASAASFRGFFKQARPEALLLLSLLALRLLFYARWSSWDGREWGPRYLVPLLPVLLVPLICLPARHWIRIGAIALAALGVGVELLGQLVPYDTLVWPTTAPLVVSTLQLRDASGSTCLCSWLVDAAASTTMDFDIRFAPLTRQVTLLFQGTVDSSWSNAWLLRSFLLAIAASIAFLLWRSALHTWQRSRSYGTQPILYSSSPD